MAQTTIKQLLEAGVHFGHQTQRWNPKMKRYIFGERNGIYIINLEITLSCLTRALNFIKEVAQQGKEILMVGTKKQAQDHLREAAERCEMPYVDQRWLGGMLTNFETIRKSVSRLDRIDLMEQDGSFQFMKKKEVLMLTREREKLLKNLKGIRRMRRIPGALFVIDSKKEEIAIREAIKLGIPVVSVIDTNSDPDLINYPIPGNDDAIRAIKLFVQLIADAIQDGRQTFLKTKPSPTGEGEQPTETGGLPEEEVAVEAAEYPSPVSEKVDEPFDIDPVAVLPEDSKAEILAEQILAAKVVDDTSKEKIKKSVKKEK